MKVLFVTKFYPPVEGGIERYSHALCTALHARGVDVEVVAAAQGARASRVEEVDGITIHRLGLLTTVRRAPVTPGLPSLLRELAPQFDLVHHNFPNPWAEICHLATSRGAKSLVTYHSDIYRQKVLLNLYRPWIHRFLEANSAIIATSPNYIESSPFLRRYRDRCRSIPLPVLVSPLGDEAATAEVRARYGNFVLFVGRLVYYKGLEFLIEAIGALERVELVVSGQGPMEHKFRGLARKLGLDKRVHFLGMIDDDRLRHFYAASRCLVLPSIFRSEAFGMVLGEAMAYGTPVISTELGTGTSYINQHGATGFVVPPADSDALADKIALICGDEALHAELGANARKRIEDEFDKEVMIDRTLALYEDLVVR
ncbi:MAG: glycosyl transferase family 1 [Euryarchaeota archaeon]|nr:glycosyl transferase family 1 [Euryarchaeota archaeon]